MGYFLFRRPVQYLDTQVAVRCVNPRLTFPTTKKHLHTSHRWVQTATRQSKLTFVNCFMYCFVSSLLFKRNRFEMSLRQRQFDHMRGLKMSTVVFKIYPSWWTYSYPLTVEITLMTSWQEMYVSTTIKQTCKTYCSLTFSMHEWTNHKYSSQR